MKIALLGQGKTGQYVKELHHNTLVFDSKTKPTLDQLKECDVIISFLPGNAFLEHIDLIIQSKRPLICGSTGFVWPQDIHQRLLENNLVWIRSHNFSLGMNIIKIMIKKMSQLKDLYPDGLFSIHDIHHINKMDKPSGTALSWKEWLNQDCEITAERTGDIVGYHHIEFSCEQEEVKLVHNAKHRSIFAKGAIFAANFLMENNLSSGLHDFNNIIRNYLNIPED